MYVIGIDPGPVAGVVRLELDRLSGLLAQFVGAEALQVTPGLVDDVVGVLGQRDSVGNAPAIAVERFVAGPRAARSSTPKAGRVTAELVTLVADLAARQGLRFHARSAALVKPWATDARLAAAGLLAPTTGMRHARDAARHALFCAVKDYGLPDPLSAGSRLHD
jgi:hypothetical protein